MPKESRDHLIDPCEGIYKRYRWRPAPCACSAIMHGHRSLARVRLHALDSRLRGGDTRILLPVVWRMAMSRPRQRVVPVVPRRALQAPSAAAAAPSASRNSVCHRYGVCAYRQNSVNVGARARKPAAGPADLPAASGRESCVVL